MKLTEREVKAKTEIENLIKSVWNDYSISNVEFIYQLKKAKADKRRAGKFSKLYSEQDLKDIYIGTYTHYINDSECKKITLTLYTATQLTATQLTAFFCFNDASINWSPELLRKNINSI